MNTHQITDPHELAKAGLVAYTGDVNPVSYDGYWYDSESWESDGYASAVEVCCLPDGPDGARLVVVSRVTINKPRDMEPAFKCCGIEGEDRDNVRAQIEAVKGYMGGEPDESDWREPSSVTFLIPDDEGEDFTEYQRTHGARLGTEEDVWELLAAWVGRGLHR